MWSILTAAIESIGGKIFTYVISIIMAKFSLTLSGVLGVESIWIDTFTKC